MIKEQLGMLPPIPDSDATPPMLVGEISRLFGLWMRTNSGEATGIMSKMSARILMGYLAHHDGVSQLELAEAVKLRPPTVSVILKEMEEEDLVRRETNEDDQRAVRVYLTDKGHGYDAYICENLRRADRLVMQDFTDEEYEAAKKVLLRMRNNILKELAPKREPAVNEGKTSRKGT